MLIGSRVRVFWESEDAWFEGSVESYDAMAGLIHVLFDDGDEGDYELNEYVELVADSTQEEDAGPQPGSESPTQSRLQWRRVRFCNDGVTETGVVVLVSLPLIQVIRDVERSSSIYLNVELDQIEYLERTSVFEFEPLAVQELPLLQASGSELPLLSLNPLEGLDLTTTDVRKKLHQYQRLIEHCVCAKEWQATIAAHFAEDQRLGHVFHELQSLDRGLRLTAARFVCALAHESPPNQQTLLQLNGFSFYVLRIFSIPGHFKHHYEVQCGKDHVAPSQPGFLRYLKSVVEPRMHRLTTRLHHYYSRYREANRPRLPMVWSCPHTIDDAVDMDYIDNIGTDISNVPDPETHLIGFILGPEPDCILPKYLPPAEIDAIARLFSSGNSQAVAVLKQTQCLHAMLPEPVNRFVVYDDLKEAPLVAPFLDDYGALGGLVAAMEQLNADAVRWKELFAYMTTRLHVAALAAQFGEAWVHALLDVFKALVPQTDLLHPLAWVWNRQLLASLEHHSMLALDFRICGALDMLHEPEAALRPYRLVTFLTRLRQCLVPKPAQKPQQQPKEAPAKKLKKLATRGRQPTNLRITNAIASAQAAVASLRETQNYHERLHPRHKYHKHMSNVETIETYVTQQAHAIETELRSMMASTTAPPPRSPRSPPSADDINATLQPRQYIDGKVDALRDLDEIAEALHTAKRERELAKQRTVQRNKMRLERQFTTAALEAQARETKWEMHCEQLAAQKRTRQAQIHRRNVLRQERVREQLHQQIEARAAEVSPSATTNTSHAHPVRPKEPTRPRSPPPKTTTPAPSRRVRCQSARPSRDRAVAFGNIMSDLQSAAMAAKKEEARKLWRVMKANDLVNSKLKMPPPTTRMGTEAKEDGIKHQRMSFLAPRTAAVAEPIELPLANAVMCQKLATELVPPEVRPPEIEDDTTPTYIVVSKYNRTLSHNQRQLFKARFAASNVKLNHKLSYAVQDQYVQMTRRNQAWEAFSSHARLYSDDPELLKRTELGHVVQKAGMPMDPRLVEAAARRLDKKLTGFITWHDFYEWFTGQDYQRATSRNLTSRT
ncbi:hypothetical protein ACHHYP_03928 [Achlya hypogyna]|uniref:EF-hand domain-containing protein n=1 Tax=Achlya hypogyna TaxID=1202772 RepID=A0A1V9Z2V9_ACHHY|nr:hypothetical protein ACHHYP_03928 [Achlya hypogyna]